MASSSFQRSERPRTETAGESLSVDAALLTLTPRFTTERPLSVAGKVHAVRTYNPWHYVDLGGNQAKLTLRLPSGTPAPAIGHHIVVHGTLSVQPSAYHGGLEVFLTGSIQGTYRTESLPASAGLLRRVHEPARLSWLLSHEHRSTLLVIATSTGWEDARNAARVAEAPDIPWTRVEGNFGDRGQMIALLRDIADRDGCHAVAVLRGGGDARSLELWDDPDVVEALLGLGRPFYTALGHSTNVLLADRYADESFDTPTAFGNAVGQLMTDRGRFSQTVAELTRIREQLARTEASAREKQRTLMI
ncbi:MAG TPA: exodeoxyribonuclease VII large subunit, partial [Longimicrobium sp.]|nr:exodeoxyribonuclease VII large subunit [Longimicrobium sp.]